MYIKCLQFGLLRDLFSCMYLYTAWDRDLCWGCYDGGGIVVWGWGWQLAHA